MAAAPSDDQVTTSSHPGSVTTGDQRLFSDTPPFMARLDRQLGLSELPVAAAVGTDADKVDTAPEQEPAVTMGQTTKRNDVHADISAEPQPQTRAAGSKPQRLDSEKVSRRRLDPPQITESAAPKQAISTASPTSVADNDRWLFTQPPDFYTLQLISAPRRATVDAFIRQKELENIRLLRTQVKGVRWWYLLSGSYPTLDQANDAAAASTVEQTNIWIRRFGALQENRCKNLSTTGLSSFCDGTKVRVAAAKRQQQLDVGERPAPAAVQSVTSVEQLVVTAPAGPPVSAEPQPTPTESTVAAELLAITGEKQTAIAGLRHDDNAWLFAQPEGYYTVQLISVPDVSQIARFLRDNKLQHKAIYYTTRREHRDWYFAIYGSHPDLDAAKHATKSLPVASGSVWIRQFDAIQKGQCQVANQLPAGVSDTLNFYCRP
jgi:septal ring-binding cell division protein DamX